jgi:MFS transporter, PAT family, beta-lactamase induction signal transducer AmpG
MTETAARAAKGVPHPMLFAALMYPFGAQAGYLTVALAYDLGKAGVNLELVGAMIAISFIPNTWKFLWAPVLDITLTPRVWYVMSAILSAAMVLSLGFLPANDNSLVVLDSVVFLSSLAVTFNGMSVDILGAQTSPPDQKGRFAGWMQVGNLAGGGIGGGLALWLSETYQERWIASTFLAVTFLLCPLALLLLPKTVRVIHEAKVIERVVAVAKDSWALARSRAGALAILVLFLPLGTGAASGLWAAVAGDWNASANSVAMATGVWSGVVSGVGCLIGGKVCDLIDRKWSYALFALVQAGCAVLMAFAPRTEIMYIVFTLAYALTSGLTYASFCAVTLEAIGTGSAATKYNLLASLSNFPIQYMTIVDGRAHTLWGATGMLMTEALVAVAAVFVYVVVKQYVSRTPGAALRSS